MYAASDGKTHLIDFVWLTLCWLVSNFTVVSYLKQVYGFYAYVGKHPDL